MSVFKNIEEARAYFKGDRFAVNAGVVIDELLSDAAVCHFDIAPDHLNAENGVMGGAIFTLVDLTFAVAANNVHLPTVVQQVSMNFLSNSRGARMTATAKCRKDGKTSCVYNVDVIDDLGRDIAQAVITGYKLKTR